MFFLEFYLKYKHKPAKIIHKKYLLIKKLSFITVQIHLCRIVSNNRFGSCPALLSEAVFELELPSAMLLAISIIVLTPTSTFSTTNIESVETATSVIGIFAGMCRTVTLSSSERSDEHKLAGIFDFI